MQNNVRSGCLNSVWLLLFSFCWSGVQAKEVPCDTTQPSENSFPLLEQECPIGKGLWGKQLPKDERAFFWIQCGVFKTAALSSLVTKLYPHISTSIQFKQDEESQAYRCLIGPYTDYVQAKMELVAIQKHVDFRQAFLRQVPLAALPQVEEKKITIGVSATVNGTKYIVPYFWDETIPFYTEYSLAWNRLRYDEARQMCQILNMRLATEQEWQQLLDSDATQNDPWPVELPYWGEGQKGFFMNGNINTLKATSQLNILCVQES
ncbi:hypothetical protein EXA18_07615 [Vibrio cincinnatiensis]|uniref:SPOR domain-containing protein n=1 Tax=Vibrio cincinnatiensis TaxID=675 RepID=UPI001EDFB741|nr:hypothetical protein [Vibrio cincinnatiensis]MCG3743349.1 hypothetical protein [Vibrio cincinnatiensis]